MDREIFGITPDGTAVERVQIQGGGLTAWVMGWGACLQDLRLDGYAHPLVLGFDRFVHYPVHSRNFGAITGRCANRIRDGRFHLEGEEFTLDRNADGHHLHGGRLGVSRRNWTISRLASHSVTMTLADPDGMMGYPGTCRLSATYSCEEQATLRLCIEAETDRVTLVNLAPHSYFNLDGAETICSHTLEISAQHYLVTGPDSLPTGEMRPVDATPFDFRRPRMVDSAATFFDHNYCLSRQRVARRPVARLSSPFSGIAMTLATTEAGLQFYDGHKLDVPVAGLDGRRYGANAGLCLEPQVWPDAVNQPGFPTPLLRPGERYVQESEYRFAFPGAP